MGNGYIKSPRGMSRRDHTLEDRLARIRASGSQLPIPASEGLFPPRRGSQKGTTQNGPRRIFSMDSILIEIGDKKDHLQLQTVET